MKNILFVILILALIATVPTKSLSTPETDQISKNKTKAKTNSEIIVKEIKKALNDPPPGGYKIFAVKVGERDSAKKRLFVGDAKKDEMISITFSFCLLTGRGKTVLVDTGFVSRRKIKEWKIKNYRDPVASLAAMGIHPESITDIIITHRHWDHIGGISLFTRPRIWINRNELKDALNKYEKQDKKIFKTLQSAKTSDRLSYTKQVTKILPGIVTVQQGSHTKQFQYVVVNNTDGICVLSSDVGPMYENFRDL